jgi:nitroreductase
MTRRCLLLAQQMNHPQWADVGMFLATFALLAREEGLDTCFQEAWAQAPPPRTHPHTHTHTPLAHHPRTHTRLPCEWARALVESLSAVHN